MTTVADLQQRAAGAVAKVADAVVTPGFNTLHSFELLQRQAKLLASSNMVPAQYRSQIVKYDKWGKEKEVIDNPQAISNCVIALNIALRMNADPLMVCQNLYPVENRPSWSAQWIISAINTSGKFSPLRFEITDLGPKTVEYTSSKWVDNSKVSFVEKFDIHDFRCVAWVIERATGERLESPPISMEVAVKEGWYSRNGSKWKTMPEVMMRYRAAAFFGRLYAPEILMGMPTSDESEDFQSLEQQDDGVYSPTEKKEPESVLDLRAKAAAAKPEKAHEPVTIDSTAEVVVTPVKSQKQTSEPAPTNAPSFEDAIAEVRDGQFDVALDIARTLNDEQKNQVVDAVNLARSKQRRSNARSKSGEGFDSVD